MTKWYRLRELPWSDRWLLLQAALLLVYAKIRLPFVGFRLDAPDAVPVAVASPAAQDNMPSAAPTPSAPDIARAQAVARLVAVASRYCVVSVACLHRSLVLWWLLRRRGIASQIRIGVRSPGDGFEAHAWVECAGVPLGEAGDPHAVHSAFAESVIPTGVRAPWGGLVQRPR